MKNVLITLGCSFTQGDGCWDESLLNSEFDGKTYDELSNDELSKYFHLNHKRFLELGWPSQLQEMLGYDELYNLGFGGASISHSVKMFTEDIYYRDFKDARVLVVQLLSFPERISFYKKGVVNTFRIQDTLNQEYIKNITVDIDNSLGDDNYFVDDTTLESYFYMKVMKELCEKKGWNFLFTSVRGNENLHLRGYLDKNCIESNFMHFSPSIVNYSDEYKSICGHPNEKWYKIMAHKMYEWILKNKKQIPIGISNTFTKERVLPKSYISFNESNPSHER